jgi:hypothetical protein
MDGNGTLFGTLSGNTREILHKFTVDLPKKHGRGGQSALRFARLRMEKRHNYVRKVGTVDCVWYGVGKKQELLCAPARRIAYAEATQLCAQVKHIYVCSAVYQLIALVLS